MIHTMPKLSRTHLTEDVSLHFLPTDVAIGQEVEKKAYKPFETIVFSFLLNRGEVIVDVGANIGVYTLLAAKGVGPEGTVYSFEPEPTNFMLLMKNISHNRFDNVHPFLVALGQEKGEGKLFISEDNYGDHRLYREDESERKYVSVKIETLDAILCSSQSREKISCIKIDTQGYEPFVVRGAKKLLQTDRPDVLLSYWPYGIGLSNGNADEMLEFFESLYPQIYFLDSTTQTVQKATKEDLDSYCQSDSGGKHCTILFTTKTDIPFI